jgi:hypothetical protein
MPVRRHVLLVVFAVLLAACAVAGPADLALTFGPALLLASLLLVDRFPGEALIVARRTARRARPRPAQALWPRRRERCRASLLERSVHTLRGPPVVA